MYSMISCISHSVEVQPVKFGENSFLELQFKESYRREKQREDREGNEVRKRRALSASSEQFSIRFRTRHDGLLLLATDTVVTSVSGYTVVEVSLSISIRPFSNDMEIEPC